MEDVTLDPQRQERAKEYAKISRRFMLVDLIIGILYVLAWLGLGWSLDLKDYLLQWTSNDWLLVAGFGIVFGAVISLLTLPLSYYTGFVLPHRFEQSNQTLKGWITDQIKGILVSGPIGLLLLEVIYAILRGNPITWWLWAAGFLLVFNVLLTNLAPILLFPIFYKFIPLEDEHADLVERLLTLAERANTKVNGVYKFDMSRRTKAANAALTGIGNSRRIILGDTLIDEFTSDEIETILAHELAHHVNKDIPLGIMISSVTTLVGLYLASLGLNWGVNFFGFESAADIAALPLFGLVLGAFSFVTMPLGNAWSRSRERMADTYALETTKQSSAFISAFTRLANQNLSDVDPEPWVEWLLHSHPAISKRIAMAREFEITQNPVR
ncbi:MAG: M48 family metallopeptidase [Anaerolineales bacterium]|nr:M48 family metallopeptidase [Chloroflexota bacterium]MBL6981652.1 M48 family metallopeptidase [Anaerolineales bacterium]